MDMRTKGSGGMCFIMLSVPSRAAVLISKRKRQHARHPSFIWDSIDARKHVVIAYPQYGFWMINATIDVMVS